MVIRYDDGDNENVSTNNVKCSDSGGPGLPPAGGVMLCAVEVSWGIFCGNTSAFPHMIDDDKTLGMRYAGGPGACRQWVNNKSNIILSVQVLHMSMYGVPNTSCSLLIITVCRAI